MSYMFDERFNIVVITFIKLPYDTIYYNCGRWAYMTFELELKSLCEEFVNILSELKDRQEISDEELKIHLKTKLNFLKGIEEKNHIVCD